MYHRVESAPYCWSTRKGSTVLPFVLLIFFTLGIQNEAVGNDIPESGFVEEHGSEGVEGVEPAAGLINALCDEIGREVFLEQSLLSKGSATGRKAWHRNQTNVKQIRDPAHGTAIRGRPGDLIDTGRCRSISASFFFNPALARSSSTLPITSMYSGFLSLTQMGMGVPQKR